MKAVIAWYAGMAYLTFVVFSCLLRLPGERFGARAENVVMSAFMALLWPLTCTMALIMMLYYALRLVFDAILMAIPWLKSCHPLDWLFCWPANLPRVWGWAAGKWRAYRKRKTDKAIRDLLDQLSVAKAMEPYDDDILHSKAQDTLDILYVRKKGEEIE